MDEKIDFNLRYSDLPENVLQMVLLTLVPKYLASSVTLRNLSTFFALSTLH